jgi:glycine oxidase
LPEIAHIRNPRLLKALKQDVLSKHVTLIENCELGQVTLRHQRVHDIHTSHGKIAVNELILTTGAWTRAFFQQHLIGLLDTPSIYPAKGEMLLFEAAPDMLKRIVLDGDHYLIPRRDGKIFSGEYG